MPKIHTLVERGNLKAVRALLDQDATLIYQPVSKTEPDEPLHLAAWQGDIKIVALLIGRGAHLNARGDHGWTPLHYAAQHGSLEVVKLLISAGADMNVADRYGFTPMLRAVRGREPSCLEVAQLLRQSGAIADLNSLVSLRDTVAVQEWLKTKTIADAIEPLSLIEDAVIAFGWDALESDDPNDVFQQHVPLLKCLVEAGAGINAIGSSGYPAIFTALQSGPASLVRWLLENDAEANFEQDGISTSAIGLTGGDEGREIRTVLKEFGFGP